MLRFFSKVFVLILVLLNLARSQSSCSLDADGRAAKKVEVLILGGGVAGVAAGRALEVDGVQDFLVLEATDRVGGRVREYDNTTIEVGANWIHGLDPNDLNHHPIWREWTQCDTDGPGGSFTPDLTAVYDRDGTEVDIEDRNGDFRTRRQALESALESAYYESPSIDRSVRQGIRAGGWIPSGRLDNFIEWTAIDSDVAVPPDNLSLLICSQETTSTAFTNSGEEATGDYLIVDDNGYSYFARCLARNFINDRIKLNTIVTKIRVADDCVCAEVQGGGMYCGDYGIVTFSAAVLQAAIRGDKDSIVSFDPPLPQWKVDAINQITPIFYGKIFLVFPDRFWEETVEDQQILGYVSDTRGYYAYYVLDKNRPNTITVDVTEALALRIATQSESDTVNELMTILRKIFNNDNIPEPETVVISKWPLDPLFRQSYSTFGPGVSTSVFGDLERPVNDRLYFAGEALNRTNHGSVHAAYGSGMYAVRQISTDGASNHQVMIGLVLALTFMVVYMN